MLGHGGSYPPFMMSHDMGNDFTLMNQISELIADDYLNSILVSQDVCYKMNLSPYGGGGYALIPTIIVTLMLKKGITAE